MAGKRCQTGYHRSRTGNKCVKNRPKRQPKCESFKSISRTWNSMSETKKVKYNNKAAGNKTGWNVFVAEKRKGCKQK